MDYCKCHCLCSAEFAISVIILIAAIGLLVLWGVFIKNLIRNEYDRYYKEKERERHTCAKYHKKIKKANIQVKVEVTQLKNSSK